jgi:hypothetical protein
MNTKGGYLTRLVVQAKQELNTKNIIWLSPLQNDDLAEYRDGSFLERLGLSEHKKVLRDFWPKNGPQWDGLGRAEDSSCYFLIEAKANIPEIISDCGAVSRDSIRKIGSSLEQTQNWARAKTHIDWTKGFYQYANRIAHLYFFNKIVNVPAYMVFLYFINDTTHEPTGIEEWQAAIKLQKRLLGISDSNIERHVIELFLPVDEIQIMP